jgi:hypothetical protein
MKFLFDDETFSFETLRSTGFANTVVPRAFWHEMRDQQLVSPDAPLPIDP